MKKTKYFLAALAIVCTFSACKKTPDYLPVPYVCLCGAVTWFGTSFNLLDANYVLADSSITESRRYYVTADAQIVGEYDTHGLNTIIQISDIDGGGNFYINEGDTINQFASLIEEFNVNDPLDSLRQYVPVEGTVHITAAPISGGNETVNFQMVLRELDNGNLVGSNINYSGSFIVYIND